MKNTESFILKIIAAAFITFFIANCSKDDSDKGESKKETQMCPFQDPGLKRADTYGSFTSSTDLCHAFDGSVSRWDGMAEPVALMALPTASFKIGESCGQCFRMRGVGGVRIGRVVIECPECDDHVVKIDQPSHEFLTGSAVGGVYDVEMTPIPCPLTQPVTVVQNPPSMVNSLNLNIANHATPVKKVEVLVNGAFENAQRLGDSGDFTLVPSVDLTAGTQVRITDIFDQTVQGPFDFGQTKNYLPAQFGDCSN